MAAVGGIPYDQREIRKAFLFGSRCTGTMRWSLRSASTVVSIVVTMGVEYSLRPSRCLGCFKWAWPPDPGVWHLAFGVEKLLGVPSVQWLPNTAGRFLSEVLSMLINRLFSYDGHRWQSTRPKKSQLEGRSRWHIQKESWKSESLVQCDVAVKTTPSNTTRLIAITGVCRSSTAHLTIDERFSQG